MMLLLMINLFLEHYNDSMREEPHLNRLICKKKKKTEKKQASIEVQHRPAKLSSGMNIGYAGC